MRSYYIQVYAPLFFLFSPLGAAAAPSPIQTQTIGAVTVTITGVAWRSYKELDLRPNPTLNYSKMEALTATFNVKGPPPDLRPGDALERRVSMWFVTPDGQKVVGIPVKGDPHLRAFVGGVPEEWVVDPRWPVRIECSYNGARLGIPVSQLPNPDRLVFMGIPVPRDHARLIDLGMTKVAADGVRLTLDKVGVQPSQGAAGVDHLFITGHWLPPQDNPGLTPSIGLARGFYPDRVNGLEDDTGSLLTDQRHHPGVGGAP